MAHGNPAFMDFGILIKINVHKNPHVNRTTSYRNRKKLRKEKSRLDLVILDNEAIKKPLWYYIFLHNDARNDDANTLLGNAPFLVENKTRNIVVFGTSKSEECYIQEY